MSEQLNRIEQFLITFAEQTNKQFDHIHTRLEQVDLRLENVEVRLERVEVRLEKVEVRLEKVEDRLDQVDVRFDQIDKRFEEVHLQFGEVKSQLDRIEVAQNEDIIAMLSQINNKTTEIKDMSLYTIKDQAIVKFEIENLKSKMPAIRSYHPDILDQI